MARKVKVDIVENNAVEIRSLSHDGRGIATVNQKTAFILGALPQEKVTCHITHKRGSYQEGEVRDILEASAERAVPPCQHFGICGGCSLQHMQMSMQLALKQQTLLDQLKHFGQVTPLTILPALHATEVGYRRKARLGVKFVIKKDKLLIGFREKSSRYLADIERCAVLHPKVGEHLSLLAELISNLSAYQHIAQIEVAIGDDDQAALVFRHLTPLSEEDQQKLVSFGKTYHFHLYLQPGGHESVHKIWPTDLPDRLTYSLPDHQLAFLFHPLDFTQVNLEMNRLMINQAIQLLDIQAEDLVLDLFCGIGNFTLPMARLAKHVTGIEGSEEMVARANENAHYNAVKNVSYHAANLFADLADVPWLKMHYNKILLDPPRAGAKEILPHLMQLQAKRIVYVSCNPATLARDAGELVNRYGYQLTHAGVMNMFPHTSHIEAMAVFEK
jgi:23S rRNA (uracil1939-C5)-methyltransferase